MSSILEALRELETRQPPAAQSVVLPAEEPAARHHAIELVGIASIGLLVGIVGFILVFMTAGLVGGKSVDDESAPAAPDASTAPAPPTWLDRADPPRARVDPASRAGDAPAPLPARPRPSTTAGSGRFTVVAIEYSPNAPERIVALRFDDDTVVRLHERESARGLEVQLIQADSAYVKRGGEIFVLAPPR